MRDARPLVVALWLLPGIGSLALLFGSPLLTALLGAFGIGTGGLTLGHFERLVADPMMRAGFLRSIYFSIAPIVVAMGVAIPLASLIARSFVGRRLFQIFLRIPLAVPGIVVAFVALSLLDQGGILSRLAERCGLSFGRLVRDPWGIGVIAATAWKEVPFVTMIVGAAFAAIPRDVVDAARTFGADRLRTFLLVEIPLALPGITAAVLLAFIRSMGSFVVPDLLGPTVPMPLSVMMYEAFRRSDWGLVYAIGVVLAGFSVLVLLGWYWLVGRMSKTSNAEELR